MKTKFYTVEDLKRIGKTKELGFGEVALASVMEGQLTIFKRSDIVSSKQMTINDMLPKKASKRKTKLIKIK